MKTKIKRNNLPLLRSLIFGAISITLNLFIALFLTPRIIGQVGIDAYGFVSLSSNIMSYLSIITAALNAYAARYISISYLKNDLKNFNVYYNTVFWGNVVIGSILLVILAIFIINIDNFLNISDGLVTDVQWLFGFVGLNYFVGLASVAWKIYGQIKDRVDVTNLIEGIAGLLQLIILVVMFHCMTLKVWYVGFAMFIPSIFIFIVSVKQSFRFMPEIKIKIRDISGWAFKTLILKGIWNSIDGFGNTLNSGLDLLITDLMLSPIEMGKVSVAKSVSGIIPKFYSMISQSFYPQILNAYSQNNIAELILRYKKSMKTCAIITNTIFICFVFLGRDFLTLWIPNQDIETIFTLTLLSIAPCIIEGATYPLYSVYTLTTRVVVPTIITIISGIINVISMYILLKYTELGIYAVVFTTAIIVTLVHFITPIYSCMCLKIKYFTFLPTLLNIAIILFLGIAILYPVNILFGNTSGVEAFIGKAVIMGSVCFGIQILFLIHTMRYGLAFRIVKKNIMAQIQRLKNFIYPR